MFVSGAGRSVHPIARGPSHLVTGTAAAHHRGVKGIVAVALLVILVASSCGDGSDSVAVTDVDSGLELVVSSGDRIEVRLESNPSTGYSWRVDSRAVDAFTRIAPGEFDAPIDGDRVGAAGIEVFTIDVVDAGAGVLRFEYVRPFDDPPVPERVVEYILRVHDAPCPPDPTP